MLTHSFSTPASTFSLKRKFCSQLNFPWRISSGNLHEGWRSNRRRRVLKVRMIEGVESLDAELKSRSFCDPEVLQDRNIELNIIRSAIVIAAGVTKCVLRRNNKTGRVVPMRGI